MSTTLKQLCDEVKITFEYGKIHKPYEQLDDWQKRAHKYRVTLYYKGDSFSLDFFMGEALTEEPDACGVMDCLLSDSQAGEQSFEEFCSEFGYDTDSRKAERIWKECQRYSKRVKQLLGPDYETFLYAER